MCSSYSNGGVRSCCHPIHSTLSQLRNRSAFGIWLALLLVVVISARAAYPPLLVIDGAGCPGMAVRRQRAGSLFIAATIKS